MPKQIVGYDITGTTLVISPKQDDKGNYIDPDGANVEAISVSFDQVHSDVVTPLSMYGLKQWVADKAAKASKGTLAERFAEMSDGIARLVAGKWETESKGGGNVGKTVRQIQRLFADATMGERVFKDAKVGAKAAKHLGYAGDVSDGKAVAVWFAALDDEVRAKLAKGSELAKVETYLAAERAESATDSLFA